MLDSRGALEKFPKDEIFSRFSLEDGAFRLEKQYFTL
jgi:hypothetical protein